jgi:hypothetical protein
MCQLELPRYAARCLTDDLYAPFHCHPQVFVADVVIERPALQCPHDTRACSIMSRR